jgi:SAM-dependent methyltransferase
MTSGKYGAKAARWTPAAYADPHTYLSHRAELIVSLGPPLREGETLLDLACGDGGLAVYLPELRYLGADASEEMVAAAQRQGRDVILADLNDYEPPEPVAATSCFRAIYYANDRSAFFRRVAGYTERKFVFDLNPRQYDVQDVKTDLNAAGFDRFTLRPFLSPQHRSLPMFATRLLHRLERAGPIARLPLAVRFSYFCVAFRGGKKT